MGLTYTGEVFFGAFVERDSPLGRKLDELVDEYGGTPAPTLVQGVEVSFVGSWSTGDMWMVVRAKGSAHGFGRNDDVEPPRMLTEDPAWRPTIAEFFARLDVSEPPPVGWHFAGSVM